MQKRNLRWVLIVVVVAIGLYQFFSEGEISDAVIPEPPVSTLSQPDNETDTPATAGEEADGVEVTETPIEPTVAPSLMDSLEEPTGDFDFYVMALSWSPDYCASNDNNDPQQCSIGKKLDFVLHGLWPQYDQGYPSYCSEEKMSYDLIDDFVGLYPSEKLYDHEWEKHGTCTGLSPEDYMLWSQALKDSLEIPDAYDAPAEPFRTDAEGLSEAFVSENPDFLSDSFAVYCSGSGRFLKEIFVCFEKSGEPRSCGSEILGKASRSCGQDSFLVRNTR